MDAASPLVTSTMGRSTGSLLLAAALASRMQSAAEPDKPVLPDARSFAIYMGAKLSNAATAYEHGDDVRTVIAEVTNPEFKLKQWRKGDNAWQSVLVIKAKCGFDSLNSDLTPSDLFTVIDVAVLKESLTEPESNSSVQWVPGREMLCDGPMKFKGIVVFGKSQEIGRMEFNGPGRSSRV